MTTATPPASLDILFGVGEFDWVATADSLLVRLTYIEGPDGPDPDFDGLLEIATYPCRITHTFSYRISELSEFYESLRGLHSGAGTEARFTTLLETFCVVIHRDSDGRFGAQVELDIDAASVSPVILSGFSIDRAQLLSVLRRTKQMLLRPVSDTGEFSGPS